MGVFDIFAGRRSPEDAQRELIHERQERQGELQQTLAAQDQAFNKQGQLSKEYLNTMVEHGLDESTALMLRNMLSKDFVLANLTRAEVHEKNWLSRVEMLKVKGQHPMPDSVYQGEYRQFMFDDPKAGLESLDPEQETLLDQALMDIMARISRGESMAQQDAFSKVIAESRQVDDGAGRDDSGGLFFD